MRLGDLYVRALNLIGILVVAVIDSGGPDGTGQQTVSGILRTVDEYGEFSLHTPAGIRHCWPLLHIEPAGQAHL